MTTTGFSSLPSDTWYEIAELLDDRDIRGLRAVDRLLYQTFSTDRIWKPITEKWWFSMDDLHPSEDFNLIENYCSYFFKRCFEDSQIKNTVMKIARSDDSREILEQSWDVISMKYKAIPILNRLRLNSTDFLVKYFAGTLLTSIRHSEVYALLNSFHKEPLSPVIDAEEFYLRLNHIDPCFDDLLEFRSKIINEIITKVKEEPGYDSSPTRTVVLIRQYLLQMLDVSEDVELDDQIYPEDYMILRVYACESKGVRSVHNSIVQKIASFFGIKCFITDSFLIVEDPNVQTGYSYIIWDDNVVAVLNHADVVPPGYTEEQIEELMSPIIKSDFLEPLFNYEWEFDDLYAGDECLTRFHHSKIPVPAGFIKMFKNYSKWAELLYPSFATPESLDFFFTHEEPHRLIRDLDLFPFNAIHTLGNDSDRITKETLIKNYLSFKDFALPITDLYIEKEHGTPQYFTVGDVLYGANLAGNYAIVLGMDFFVGVSYGVLSLVHSLNPFSPHSSDLEKLQSFDKELFEAFCKSPWIGLYFTGFDENTNSFIPRKRLLECYYDRISKNRIEGLNV